MWVSFCIAPLFFGLFLLPALANDCTSLPRGEICPGRHGAPAGGFQPGFGSGPGEAPTQPVGARPAIGRGAAPILRPGSSSPRATNMEMKLRGYGLSVGVVRRF
jgi:hypothetical protein